MADATVLTRVARIVNLFSEGETVLLGYDTDQRPPEPITVWVNKLNPFETQEARADGNARRSERMHWLGQPDAPEKLGFDSEMAPLSQDQLANAYVDAYADEIYLDVINDLETDPHWRDLRDRIERVPSLIHDAEAAEDDPRRIQLANDQTAWLRAIQEGQNKKGEDRKKDAVGMTREELLAALWERYRQRTTLDVFMQERRTTQLYFALRECDATDIGTNPGEHIWDHAGCDHSKRLLAERADVRGLPDSVIEKCMDSLDDMTINPRAAGNSAAPASSSASSEPASAEAEGSTPSTPTAT